MNRRASGFAGFLLAAAVNVFGADAPHISFAYPAGGQQGAAFEMTIGGQHLEGATNVMVSGEGVTVSVRKYSIKYEPRALRQIFRSMENAEAALEGKEGKERVKFQNQIDRAESRLRKADLPDGVDPLDKKEVQRHYKIDAKEQFNPQLGDRLLVEVRIADHAPPGERELRVDTPAGLSNPIYFQVGVLEEVQETEPNDDHMSPELQRVPVPCIINGQVRPGDMDHFRFDAKAGDAVVVDVSARRIIPYLADAVPGWFQAVVALYDEDGNEVAYQDDYRFHPDPVLFFDVPENGTYTLSIRDSIFRGREDFLYRIAIGELPFITGIFPLGSQQGRQVDIALSGRNLPQTRLSGTLPKEGFDVRHISVKKQGYRSNQMPFAISEEPDVFEAEPNDSVADAQSVAKPVIVNGRIQQAGDRDLFSFSGEQGEAVSIEVVARRLNSPLDSVITLTGPGLDEDVRNDDYVNKDKTHLHLGAGLVTHHADSYLSCKLPQTGTYYIEIGDAQYKGGHDYAYRLKVSRTNPDFELLMEPSGMNIAPGGTAAFTIRALRQESFKGEIRLEAARLPEGFTMSEAVIPAGSDMTRFTITAPKKIQGEAVTPEIVGVGMIDGRPVTRPVKPVDDRMQAFLYRHLVPAQELVLAPVSKRPPLFFEAAMPRSGVFEVPINSEYRIPFKGKIFMQGKGAALKLDNPPEGLSSQKGWISYRGDRKSHTAAGQILIEAKEPLKPGDQLSLVVAAEVKQGQEAFRYPAPAIPIRIVDGSQ